jgi:hypothetical protein
MKDGNQKLPTTTVSPARLRLCQPTQRPTYRTGEWIETPWGRCRVTGRFGQRHQDLIDAFLWNAEKTRQIEDGGIEILVDPAKVRKTMSDARHSLTGIQKLIRELREVTLEIETPKLMIMGGLVDHVAKSPVTRPDPINGGERQLWRVRIGLALAELLRYDLPLHYDPTPITRLQSGISQAVARHVLTHTHQPNGGWDMDNLIQSVCGELGSTMIRHRRRELRIDSHTLYEIGILIDGERVFRVGKVDQACSTRPIKRDKSSKRATPARCRAASARQNVATCGTRPVLQYSSEYFRADLSAAPDGATASSAISPPVADATTPQGVNSPAGEEVSTATTPFPAGQHHPQRGSTR